MRAMVKASSPKAIVQQIKCDAAGGRVELGAAGRGGLYPGETYVLEVPASTAVKPTSREFVVTAQPQHVSVLLERAIGRVKRNRILAGAVHHSLLPLLDDSVFFCVFSTHLVAPTEAGEVETTRPSKLAFWTRARARAAGAVATSRWRTHRSRENGQ